jgi:hypothetical protein
MPLLLFIMLFAIFPFSIAMPAILPLTFAFIFIPYIAATFSRRHFIDTFSLVRSLILLPLRCHYAFIMPLLLMPLIAAIISPLRFCHY